MAYYPLSAFPGQGDTLFALVHPYTETSRIVTLHGWAYHPSYDTYTFRIPSELAPGSSSYTTSACSCSAEGGGSYSGYIGLQPGVSVRVVGTMVTYETGSRAVFDGVSWIIPASRDMVMVSATRTYAAEHMYTSSVCVLERLDIGEHAVGVLRGRLTANTAIGGLSDLAGDLTVPGQTVTFGGQRSDGIVKAGGLVTAGSDFVYPIWFPIK